MDSLADVVADYPQYVPDLDDYVRPNCSYLNVDDLYTFVSGVSLSIFMLNIRSCKKNFDNFMTNFENCIKYFSCMILTETWLSPERDKIFNIPGFYCHDLYRNHYGGGIKLYLKDCIQSKILNNFTVLNDVLEMLTVEILFCGFKFILITVYHPPTSCPQKNVDFVTLFSSYLSNILVLKQPVIIAGDLNLNLLNQNNHFYINMFINNMFECNLRPLITKPTKVNLENPITRFSILDQIWVTEGISTTADSYILPLGITDHFPVCATVSSLFRNRSHNTTVNKRPMTTGGKETFCILLSNIYIAENAEDMNSIYSSYHKEVFKAYEIAFPLVTGSLKVKQSAPWMSYKLKQCIKKKSKLYKLYLRGVITREAYTIYKNRLTNAIRRSKALYYSKLFYENAKNSKVIWSIINSILNKRINPTLEQVIDNGVALTGEVLANYANNYFVNIAATLSDSLPNSQVFHCLALPTTESCYFYPANLEEVIKIIRNLKNNGSKLLDIHPSIVKENAVLFGNHFMVLYNISLVKAVFPNLLKIARVNPAHKSGETNIIDNYRPISSLPLFSKIFERLTLRRMEGFLNRYNILTPCQFGFRKERSTSLAITKLVSLVVQAYHQKIYCVVFFLDLKKAFDTVNHGLLIKKLEHYGFRGQCSDYLRSYYNNRKQYVHLKDHDSSCKQVINGVPQGSILGPLCFSLYINDIPMAVKDDVILFADDAAFIIRCPTLSGLYEKIRELFTDLTSYLNMNKLIPNSAKSKLMIFRSRLTPELPSFSFAGSEIEWVSEYKYLGLTVTSNLNYSNHINNISLKISRITGTFTCLRTIVPRNILMKLYYALVFPHLSNNITVWGSAPNSHLKPLIVRVNNILRIILGVTWENHRPTLSNNELYRHLNILNLGNLYKLNLYKLLRLLLDGALPEFWQLLLARYTTPHAYNTRGIRFRHPNITSEVERRALSYQLILLLEELPANILDRNPKASAKLFKRNLLESQ